MVSDRDVFSASGSDTTLLSSDFYDLWVVLWSVRLVSSSAVVIRYGATSPRTGVGDADRCSAVMVRGAISGREKNIFYMKYVTHK